MSKLTEPPDGANQNARNARTERRERDRSEVKAIEMAARAIAHADGDAAALAWKSAQLELMQRAEATRRKQVEARAISATRVAMGEGAEHRAELGADALAEVERNRRGNAARTRGEREARTLRKTFRAIVGERYDREERDADALAARALEAHGIRHHYRPMCKVAWFAAYRAGLDANGIAALRALQSINMPVVRQAEVLEAAYGPEAYAPRRNVCAGKRAEQRRYQHDGRTFGGKRWTDGLRDESHPGAIAVIQCALFLWLSKHGTTRRGFSYVVRGFGRGLFASLTGRGKDALTGHTRGLPGALLALRQAGFIQYAQPPAEVARSARDLGPTGHAYTVYWFRSTPEERDLDAYHARVAELARMPLLERLALHPDQLAALDTSIGGERAPPGVIDPASVPY